MDATQDTQAGEGAGPEDGNQELFQSIHEGLQKSAPGRIFLNLGPSDSFDEPSMTGISMQPRTF